MIERSQVQVPAEVVGKFSLPGSTKFLTPQNNSAQQIPFHEREKKRKPFGHMQNNKVWQIKQDHTSSKDLAMH